MGKRKGRDDMAAKSANLYARIEPDVKEQAEGILATLGKMCIRDRVQSVWFKNIYPVTKKKRSCKSGN